MAVGLIFHSTIEYPLKCDDEFISAFDINIQPRHGKRPETGPGLSLIENHLCNAGSVDSDGVKWDKIVGQEFVRADLLHVR